MGDRNITPFELGGKIAWVRFGLSSQSFWKRG
jgi:hypothetical protein